VVKEMYSEEWIQIFMKFLEILNNVNFISFNVLSLARHRVK
jgi:hypothetical protein